MMKVLRSTILLLSVFLLQTLSAQERTARTLQWYPSTEAVEKSNERVAAPERVPSSDRPTERSRVSRTEKSAEEKKSEVQPSVPDRRIEPFKGAFIDPEKGGLPFYNEIRSLSGTVTGFTVHLQNAQYVPLKSDELDLWDLSSIGEAPEVLTELSWYRKQPQAIISIYPFRKVNGITERLVSFDLQIVEEHAAMPKGGGPKNYPSNSKLASGDWYRFMVHADGIYRISYSFLEDLGVAVNGLASDQINIYGNHFGMLPFRNDQFRPTDLLINAIQVNDGGDGMFGPGDEILFYATGPQRWDLDGEIFEHSKNVFTDSASYFIGIGIDPPNRVAPAQLSDLPATRTVTAFNDRQYIDRDQTNLLKSGRTWYGDHFDNILTYNYNFEVPYITSDSVTLEFTGCSRTVGLTNSSSWTVTCGSAFSTNFEVGGVSENYVALYARPFDQAFRFPISTGNLPVTVTFNKHHPITSLGWMDYLRLNCRRGLRMVGDQFAFRDLESVGIGEIAEFQLELAQNADRIWEITDPTNVADIAFTNEGAIKRFKLATDTLRQFIAFRNSGFLEPKKVGRVPNQDLHATISDQDLVIVAAPSLLPAAQRLAERRANEGLTVTLVTAQQVYNEFSSGARDASAIKRYMKMLYDRAGTDPAQMPKNLLLFGDGSYNNWSLASTGHVFLPSYQTVNSVDPTRCYTSDDYFGFLDDGETEATSDLVDIGVGRLPVSSLGQANEVVTKILNHDRLLMLSSGGSVCSTTGDGGLADWRNHVVFISDDQNGDNFEGAIHMSQSNILASRVIDEHPELNVGKILLDAYQQLTITGGNRYPQAEDDIRSSVQKGALLVNYIGHGGEVGWAHERILDNTTILEWTNTDRLPVFMTATCEFSRWDDPGRTSAGEYVLLNPNGGGIALMTTTRVAFSDQNFQLSQKFYDHVFERNALNGEPQTLGDIFRETKRDIAIAQSSLHNHRNFSLLGDPSQGLALPHHEIQISSVTDTLGNPIDTLKALSTVRVTGFVDDGSGQPMADFNGQVIPMLYDKEITQTTLANDGGTPFNFRIRKNIIYRGKATVQNGQFTFTFVVPKDINYQVGTGRISCYAESFTANATGYDNDVLVGSTATDVALDENGPRIDLFMNDENFVRGGLTDENPLLFAKLFDDNGINTVGSSIGHDLLAIVDENTDQAIVLNDLYEADLDTYKSGSVRYRLTELAEGSHTLSLKAWDVFNNSSEARTEFIVAPSEELTLAHVLNYPNPFTTQTQFFFEHNRPCNVLDVQVQVFTVSGRLVKTIDRQLHCDGYRSEPLPWDGRDEHGDKLGRGVYVYRLNVTTPEGEKADKFEKLVILR